MLMAKLLLLLLLVTTQTYAGETWPVLAASFLPSSAPTRKGRSSRATRRITGRMLPLGMAKNTEAKAATTEFFPSVLGKEIAFDETTGRFFETRQQGMADRNRLSVSAAVEYADTTSPQKKKQFLPSVLGKEIAFDEITGRFFETKRPAAEPKMMSDRQQQRQSSDMAAVEKQTPKKNNQEPPAEIYRDAATKLLSNFMQKQDDVTAKKGKDAVVAAPETARRSVDTTTSLANSIDFDAPKITNLPLDVLAQALDAELYEKEWFVTGNVNPRYFANEFQFRDPGVSLSGIDGYSKGVQTIFDQNTACAEIISTIVNPNIPNTITCTWRLSGRVNIGPGLNIKPYIVYTDFTVDETTGLIVFQEDKFDLPQWDILVSALFPFAIGKLTKDAAPPPPPRTPPALPNELRSSTSSASSGFPAPPNPLDALQNLFGGLQKK